MIQIFCCVAMLFVLLSFGGVAQAAETSGHVPELVSISVTNPPKKTVYKVGDNLNLEKLAVSATYSDGSTKVVPLTSADVTGFSSASPQEKQILNVTVSEKGAAKTATFQISITK